MESPCLCSSEGPTNICFFPPSKLPSRLTHIFWFVKFILASSLVPSTLHPKKSFSPLIPLNVLVHPTPKKLKRFFFFTLKTHQMLSFYTSPEKFKNGVYTQKIQQISSVHTTPQKFKNTTIQSHFGFVFEEKHGQGNSFRNDLFSKLLLSSRKRKVGVLKFLRFE